MPSEVDPERAMPGVHGRGTDRLCHPEVEGAGAQATGAPRLGDATAVSPSEMTRFMRS
jgi:hypothetical protein